MQKDALVQIRLFAEDRKLAEIVDAAFADAAHRSGPWLVCRPGCTQCCHGPFPVSQLDVARLRHGLEQLAKTDPAQADAIRQRARASAALLTPEYPGDPVTGLLAEDEEALERFEGLANNVPCPVLSTDGRGRCELYAARPMTCRVFGPPIRSAVPHHMSSEQAVNSGNPASGGTKSSTNNEEIALGHCELCYHGATPEEVAACELTPGTDALEEELNAAAEKHSGIRGQTIIAFALRYGVG